MDNKGCCAMPASCETGDKSETKKGGCGPKKGCCGAMIKGALVGGVVAFLYIVASWMFIPLHATSMNGFKDEAAVAKVILDNAPKSGVYALPYVADPTKQVSSLEKPFAFVSVLTDGFDMKANMYKQMGETFFLYFFVAALLTGLLKKQTCGCPVAFSLAVGVLIALVANVPGMIWWHFPLNFTLINMADNVIATTLAGLAISKVVLRCGAGACQGCGNKSCTCKKGGGCGTEPKGSCGA
jgi:hypothetical protein